MRLSGFVHLKQVEHRHTVERLRRGACLIVVVKDVRGSVPHGRDNLLHVQNLFRVTVIQYYRSNNVRITILQTLIVIVQYALQLLAQRACHSCLPSLLPSVPNFFWSCLMFFTQNAPLEYRSLSDSDRPVRPRRPVRVLFVDAAQRRFARDLPGLHLTRWTTRKTTRPGPC